MRESGLVMTKSGINSLEQMEVPLAKQKPEKSDAELSFIKNLSTEEKEKLLRLFEHLLPKKLCRH